MAEDEVVLTRDQQRVVQAAYDGFRERCDWVKFGEIDRQHARVRRTLMPVWRCRVSPIPS
jgi:hypothetical protein